MKHDELRSIAHNIADSLACSPELDVFVEAGRSADGITVDFLSGTVRSGDVSADLADAVRRYAKHLPALCERHGANQSAFRELIVQYSRHVESRPDVRHRV